MEQVLNQILEKLTALDQGQKELKDEVQGINHRLDKLEEVQADIKVEVQEINRKTSVIFDQTANLTEFTTSATGSLGRIEEEISAVEKVTAKNCYDIAHLKIIK